MTLRIYEIDENLGHQTWMIASPRGKLVWGSLGSSSEGCWQTLAKTVGYKNGQFFGSWRRRLECAGYYPARVDIIKRSDE